MSTVKDVLDTAVVLDKVIAIGPIVRRPEPNVIPGVIRIEFPVYFNSSLDGDPSCVYIGLRDTVRGRDNVNLEASRKEGYRVLTEQGVKALDELTADVDAARSALIWDIAQEPRKL